MEPPVELTRELNRFSEPIQSALTTIHEKYDSVLSYHNSFHTKNVAKRAYQIGRALGLKERELELLQIASSFHDLVSDFDIQENDFEGVGRIKKRRMKRGANEEASAQEAEKWMNQQGNYSKEEIDLVKKAILATIPAWDKEGQTVYQPNLNKDSHPVIRALCLADIGGAGMNADDYSKDPFRLFLEEYVDFYEFFLKNKELSEKEKIFYLTQFRDFIKSQIGFVNGRKSRFNNEISGVDDDKRERLKELFSDFDRSCELIEKLIAQIDRADFDSLVKIFKDKVD